MIDKNAFVNQITLDCLVNKEYIREKIGKSGKENNRKDKNFYRKRIVSLTKELLKGEEETNLFPDVKQSFENYVKMCIKYFKNLDTNDIIQEEYNDVIDMNFSDSEEVIKKEDADKLMMRSININSKSTLDSFIKRTKLEPEVKPIIPKKKNIVLNDPILKTKGIPDKNIRKKKNINNNYEEENKEK